MKRALAFTAAGITLLLSSSACLHSGANDDLHPLVPPHHENEAHGGPAWKLRFSAACEADADKCLAAHGFAVAADGRYHVGPGPQGQVLTGYLTAAELKTLDAPLSRILDAIHPELEAGETCVARAQGSEGVETIAFNRRGLQKNIVHTTATDFCFRAPSPDDAQALHATLRELARRYYPVPFPDDCVDAVVGLHAMYGALGACLKDSDCAYLDSAYAPIPAGELQFVSVDDCSLIAPLPVANAASVQFAQEHLLVSRDRARATCGTRLTRISCEGPRGFQATLGTPVCASNVCRINPSIPVP